MPTALTKYDCYELCVQSPSHIAAFLSAVHANHPLVLREDFCGTAAVSRRWCHEGVKVGDSSRAIAIDLDAATLAKARALAAAADIDDRITVLNADVLSAPSSQPPPDVTFVGNFSIGYIHHRADLLRYLRAARDELSRAPSGRGGGIFVCDTYGGATAFTKGGLNRRHTGPGGEVIHYSWLHESADPASGLVENSISFRVEIDGEVIAEFPRAFAYRWRLWSIPELRDALAESGFSAVDVYKDVRVALTQAPTPIQPGDLPDDWIVLLVGRT